MSQQISLGGLHDGFACDCDVQMRSACKGKERYKEYEGKQYCIFHYPGSEKADDLKIAVKEKLTSKDFNFTGVSFPEGFSFGGFKFGKFADFSRATFGKDVDFTDAGFKGVTFADAVFNAKAHFYHAAFYGSASFYRVTFDGLADFEFARFTEAHFSYASFSMNANFKDSYFAGVANFDRVTFDADAAFDGTSFTGETNFAYATFKNYARFTGSFASLNMQFARIEAPERLSFEMVTLRPHWFVNLDVRQLNFTEVNWQRRSIREEVASLEHKGVLSPYRLLATACRQLAVNAEAGDRYLEASRFRYLAMHVRRRESGSIGWMESKSSTVRKIQEHLCEISADFAFLTKDWLSLLYWIASGYGERVFQAFVIVIVVLLASAWIYTKVGFYRSQTKTTVQSALAVDETDDWGVPLPRFSQALIYSAFVMTLQRPEPRPLTNAAKATVLIETIIGPVQGALLALAIRRKFMR